MIPKFQFSRFKNKSGLMAKRISLAPDGTLAKNPAAQMAAGTVETVTATLAELPAILASLQSNEAIALGVCEQAPAEIVTEKALPQHPGAVARTKDFFKMPDGLALAYFDADTDAEPEQVLDAIAQAFPAFADAAKIVLRSSSSGIYRTGEDQPDAASKGLHIYATIRDGADFRRFGESLCKRLWLAGFGQIEISEAGALLVRQPIDAATFAPERIVFEAAPILGKGLERRAEEPILLDGGILDTALCADLNAEESARYAQLVAAAKAAKEPEAEVIRYEYRLRTGKKIADKQKIPLAKAIQIVADAQEGKPLDGDFLLQFQKYGTVSVADVLADLEKYDKQILADPMEPNYRSKNCAIFYANLGIDPCVHSQAHGGKTYPVVKPARAQEPEIDEPPVEAQPEKPWTAITPAQVREAIEGTGLAEMVSVLQSVTRPSLPIEITLPKAIVLAATALSQPIDFDPKTEERKGLDLARVRIETSGGQALNAWAVIVAPSGTGKDIGYLPTRITGKAGLALGHSGSAEGLADALLTRGAGLLTLSELQNYLNPKRWEHNACSFLTESFNVGWSRTALSERNGGSRNIRYCVPSILANVQQAVIDNIGDRLLLDSGFFPRFLVSHYPATQSWRPTAQAIDIRPLQDAFDAYRQLQARVTVPQDYLQDVLDEFIRHGASIPSHYNRLINEYGPRFAVMLAYDPDKIHSVEIAPDHWRRAGILVRWFYGMAERVLCRIGEPDRVRRMEDRLARMLAFIQKHSKGVDKRVFAQFFHRGSTAEERARDIQELKDRGAILILTEGRKTILMGAK